jgi:hypothetical protein
MGLTAGIFLAGAAGGALVSKASGGGGLPPLPAPPPPLQQPDGTAAADSAAKRAKAAFGAGATAVTGPAGLMNAAPVANKTLLGQ